MFISKIKQRKKHFWEAPFVVFLILFIVIYGFVYGYPFQFAYGNKQFRDIRGTAIVNEAEGWQIKEGASALSLTATTIDPKIFFHFDKENNYLFFDIVVDRMEKNSEEIFSTQAEIYYAQESDYSAERIILFDLKKGHNIICVPSNNMYKDFRIDLTAEKGMSIFLEGILVSNYIRKRWLFKIALISLCIDAILMLILYVPKKKTKVGKIMDAAFAPIKYLYSEMVKYFKENKIVIGWTLLIAVLSYGLLCAYYTIYIDEERQIIESYATHDWVAQGRFGNYLFERFLLAGRIYTSYLGDAVAAILLGISALVQCFNYYKISNRSIKKLSQMIYCGIAISVPYICGAYMVVGIYNIEVSLAICLTNLAAAFIFAGQDVGRVRYLYSILLLVVCISIYQAFVPLFVTNVTLSCLIWSEFNGKKIDLKKVCHMIFDSAVICILALAMYYVLNRIFIMSLGSESGYLSNNFIGWGKGTGVWEIIYEIFTNIKKVIMGSQSLLLGGIIYRTTFGGLGLYVLVRFIKDKNNRLLFLFLVFCSLLAPFCMNFALGSTMFAGRTLLGIPGLLGVSWILITERLSDKNYIQGVAYGVALYLIFIQVQYINQYFLADFKRYQQDQIITQEIIADIREACAGSTQMPIVPVGVYYHENNGLTMHYELAGSYYTVDGGSIVRIIRFIQAQGYNVEMPTPEQIADSYNYIGDMPSWPVKGSVRNVDGYVIVKLSEPSQTWIGSYVLPYQQ